MEWVNGTNVVSRRAPAGQLRPGAGVSPRQVSDIAGNGVALPDPTRLVHLQFRRFAGCPACDLHLRGLARRHAEIEALGVREVVVFHSPADELRVHAGDLPFALIADPDQRLYREFGVESSWRALLAPAAWIPLARVLGRGLVSAVRDRRPMPPLRPAGGRFGLPADLLIGTDGRVLASKYGEHLDDQWSADDLIALARGVREKGPCRVAAERKPDHGEPA